MRILVIEDDGNIAEFLKNSLQSEAFIVDLAADGERGSFLARTNDYDLVILDNLLPKKNGKEVLEEIRKNGKTMPVLVLSVNNDTGKKTELLNFGADDYLAKPFSLSELLARIRALLRRPKKIESEILKCEDLSVDGKKQVVKRGKKEIYLTRKEFCLLEYLLKNKGLAVSRGMIAEHVWDMGLDPFSNTIEAHILSLRKKIEFSGKKKLIRTIPGRGYKII